MAQDNPVFEASYCRIFDTPAVGMAGDARDSEAFFDHFYAVFLKKPGIGEFFAHTDMARQKHMLKDSLFELTSCWVLGRPSDALLHVARAHAHLRIDNDALDLWLDTLLETVEEFDPEYDETVRLAWLAAMGPGIFFVKSFLAKPEAGAPLQPSEPHWYSGANDPSGPRVQ